MTDEELNQWAKRARHRAVNVGRMPGLWDLIFDVEALIVGEGTVLKNRETIERLVVKDKKLWGEK